MSPLLLASVRLYLLTLGRLAPRAAGRRAYRIFCTPRRQAGVPPEARPVMERAECFDLMAGETRVAAYRWRGSEPEGPRVMLAHGWESRAARLAVWVDPLLAAGFEVVAFDAPAHGASEGRRANPRVFAAAMQALVARTGPVEAIVGHSLGGLSALLATAGGELLDGEGLTARRLVILAGAESGVDAMRMFCRALGLGEAFLPLILAGAAEEAGRPIPDFDGHRFFAGKAIPTLWLHAPEDSQVPYEAAERVVRTCPHVTLESREGLGHRRIARDPEVLRRCLAFLAESASAEAGAGAAAS